MGHLHMRRQGLKSTVEKLLDTELEDKSKTNVVSFTTLETSKTNEGAKLLRYMWIFPHNIKQRK